jgi:lipopolysaccharide biosynthesis protein
MEKFKKFIKKWGAGGIRASLNRKKLRRKLRAEIANGRVTALDMNGLEKLTGSALQNEYIKQRFASADPKANRSELFESPQPVPRKMTEDSLKLIAFYLPQFHAIPENDQWWGKGFTEWTNVSKAQPQYLGHHQPQLPSDLGFYDLRSVDALRAQVQMAKEFGVNAFCFHYYWFGGKRLLETPINNFVKNKDLDIGFCYCWANENWTRRWDGLEGDVLIAQNHSPEDDWAFIDNLLPDFKDPRYLKIDGKPLLIIYRASLLPDCNATADRWRQRAVEAGFPGLYLVAARSFDIVDPVQYGCDAAVEFPPHQINALDITSKMSVVNPNYEGKVYDYAEAGLRFGCRPAEGSRLFKTVMPAWDNEARKPGRGYSFYGSLPTYFSQWIQVAAAHTLKNPPAERLLFCNAWNEWGEGAHLEPDTRFGYAYLNTLSRTLASLDKLKGIDSFAKECNEKFEKRENTAVFAHFFYDELVQETLEKYLVHSIGRADLFVSITGGVSLDSVRSLVERYGNVYVHAVENRGRDVKPFIEMYRVAQALGYKVGFKIHGKRSPHRLDGARWRGALIDPLFRSAEVLDGHIQNILKNPQLHLLLPDGSLVDLGVLEINQGNRKWLDFILTKSNLKQHVGTYRFHFAAGTMFGFRMDAFKFLLNDEVFANESFEIEAGQLDGTFAHAVERVLVVLAAPNSANLTEV